jgi:hypothetical protein
MEYQPTDIQPQQPKKNSNVIYFLIAVVVALLGTDVYLYTQKNKSDVKVVYQNDEKTRLQTELDSLEAQIEQVNAGRAKMSATMQATKRFAHVSKIRVLRCRAGERQAKPSPTWAKAQEDIKQLRYFVTKYTADIEELKKENANAGHRARYFKDQPGDRLAQKATDLEQKNQELDSKVKVASAIKGSYGGCGCL